MDRPRAPRPAPTLTAVLRRRGPLIATLSKLSNPNMLAFMTNNPIIALPAALDTLERDYGVDRRLPDLAELVEAVKEGRVYAGFHGGLQLDYYMLRHPETAIYIGLDPAAPCPGDISIAVRPDAPNLLRWVNVYLADHVGQLDASELIVQYAGPRAADN